MEYLWFYKGTSLVDQLEYQYWENDVDTNVAILNFFTTLKIYIGKSLYFFFVFPNLVILINFPSLEYSLTHWKIIGILVVYLPVLPVWNISPRLGYFPLN